MATSRVFCSDVCIALCLGQVRNDSGNTGMSIQAVHLHQTHWAKEMKMDLAFCLDRRATRRATFMSPHLWQDILSTSFKSRGKGKRWEGILLCSKEITGNKWNERAKPKEILPQYFEKELCYMHFYPRIKINMYLDELRWIFSILRWIIGYGVLTVRSASYKQVLSACKANCFF